MQQEKDKVILDTILTEIKTNSMSFVPQKEDLDRVVSQRDEADKRIKESGRSVILENLWRTE